MAWPTDLGATGELITATQWNRIAFALGKASGAAAAYDFTNIPAHWTNLILVASLKGDSGNNGDALALTFNNDTGNNYLRQNLVVDNATVTGNAANAAASINVGEVTGAAAGFQAPIVLWIPNYTATGTDVRRTVLALHSRAYGAAASNFRTWVTSGYWTNTTDPISRVTLTVGAGALTAVSVATLYGMGSV